MSHWIGWKEITENTKMSRDKLVYYAQEHNLPLSKHGRSPMLVGKLFYNWLETYCSTCHFEPTSKNPVK